MKKRIIVFLVAAFIIFGLSLYARGAKEAVTEEKAAAPGEPQYGGTFTVFNSGIEVQMVEPPNPDIKYSNYTSLWWLQFIQETPTYGDIERGPRGTGYGGIQPSPKTWSNGFTRSPASASSCRNADAFPLCGHCGLAVSPFLQQRHLDRRIPWM